MIAHGLWIALAIGSPPPAHALLALTAPSRAEPARQSRAAATSCDASPYDCAVRHIERGEFDAAVSALDTLRARTPRDPKILNLLGIALTGAGRVNDANRRFREALTLDARFVPARKNLAINEFTAGRGAEAESLFAEVLSQVPDDQIAHVHLGEIHYARGAFGTAIPHYEKSGDRVFSNPAWILHFGSSLLGRGDTARAVDVLDRLPRDDAASRFEAGVALGRARAHADAARFFGQARAGLSNPLAAAYNQTLMLVEAGDHASAASLAEELVRQGVTSGDIYSVAARAYVALGRIQDAYDALRNAARLEPAEERHYLDLALICLDHENFELGLEILDIGIGHVPAGTYLRTYRGVLLVMKGEIDQARIEFEKARVLAPDEPLPYLTLAMAWMQSGRTPDAVKLLRQRMQAGARDAFLSYLFGLALMRSGVDPAADDASEAIQAFEEAISLDPDLAGPRGELGKILLARGDIERAIEHLERAVALEPEAAAPAYTLAQAYRRAGDRARAQELLGRVSRLNAQSRGSETDQELKRLVVRLVRQDAHTPRSPGETDRPSP